MSNHCGDEPTNARYYNKKMSRHYIAFL
jgi:hypothetical protein